MQEERITKLDPTALVPLIPTEFDLTNFLVRMPTTIARELHLLLQGRELISVYFNSRQSTFLSALQHIDAEDRCFSFDISVDEALNSAFERSSDAVIAAMSAGVRIQFEIQSGIKRIVDFDGRPSFQAQVPSALIKLDRRESLRLPLTIAEPMLCRLRHPKGTFLEAQVHDLSIGGMGLVFKSDMDVEPGDICTACRIDLGTCGTVEVTVVIRTKRRVAKLDSSLQTVVGSSFVNLQRNAGNSLRRYINELERERQRTRRQE